MMPHVQALYCHGSSLGTVVKVELKSNVRYYQRNLVASGEKLQEMFSTTKNDIGSADLMMYMAAEPSACNQWGCSGTLGIAYVGVVCNPYAAKYKQSINEWRQTHAEAGHTIAHEFGHNLGMSHDFSEKHSASGCDMTGIMSYGPPINQWSACSKADFQAHYIANKDKWCMEGNCFIKVIKRLMTVIKSSCA